ncbi:response regulator [Oceanobacillus kimchii]|uniref:response regulator n=1 Tax=Oceanobacillus TaxID=182709 RepID=UPI0003462682|nr:response regulator [Oceanobacillus kimchii]MCT1578355.1 response regulator [Oceanobacillus kimchii]MCT2134533.1 response regulator [Oceanobacillus kimchii]
MVNVMIVEDDPMVQEVNKSFLEKMEGFHLQFCSESGKTVLDKAMESPPDLILLDMFLPDISGLDVLQEIRQKELPSDVILITAARDAKTIQQVFRLGAVDYLVKPFRFNRFQQALENYKKMWMKLQWSQSLSQEDIDDWNKQKNNMKTDSPPKGLSEITLKQIYMALLDQQRPVTAEELAEKMGMARVTVRRYLEHLEKQERITVQIEYGKVGRPSHNYSV